MGPPVWTPPENYNAAAKYYMIRSNESGSPTFSKSAWCSVTTPNGGTSDPPKIVWSPISLVAWIDSINRGKTVTEPVCPVEIGGASGSSLGLGLRPWLPSTSLGTSSSSSSTSSSSSSTWTCDGRSSSWCLSMEKISRCFLK